MRGSAVLIKENGRYQRGFVGYFIHGNSLEVWLPVRTSSIWTSREHVILDEKPNVHELAIGILVIGEDPTSPGQIRVGRIEQISNSVCTIKSYDGIWRSDLNKISIVKKAHYCSQ